MFIKGLEFVIILAAFVVLSVEAMDAHVLLGFAAIVGAGYVLHLIVERDFLGA
jgi:hypothetical protein